MILTPSHGHTNMINLKIVEQTHLTCTKYPVPIKQWVFPAGEVGIKLDDFKPHTNNYHFEIEFIHQSSNDVLMLLNLHDCIKQYNKPIHLNMKYVPYSRQDRVCHQGESFSLKVFANLINNCNFDKVVTCDNHSIVTNALFNNIEEISQHDCLIKTVNLKNYDYIVIPDVGASKKIKVSNTIQCIKSRENGIIVKVLEKHYIDDCQKYNLLVVDDIVDGGLTFIKIAEALFDINPNVSLDLYTTHGIYSKGKTELLGYYTNLFCFNDMSRGTYK